MRPITLPVLTLLACAAAPAQEVVRTLRLGDLQCDAGAPPATAAWTARVEGGEAFATGVGPERVLLVRLPAAGPLRGVLAVPGADAPLPFRVPAERLEQAPAEPGRFQAALAAWCGERLAGGTRGGGVLPDHGDRGERAWWSQRMAAPAAGADQERWRRTGDIDATLDLFTGVVALRENLQFDRALAVNDPGEAEEVALAELPALEVREIPWERLVADAAPFAADPLAARIPADQHALLVPSFAALGEAAQRLDGLLAGPLQALGGRQGDAGTLGRYQRQLGLELTELSRRFGEQVVEQVAMTGSDPFLRSGSDCAVLLRARQPALLAAYLGVRLDALVRAGAEAVSGRCGELAWRGARTADRAVSSLVLLDGEVVVVANSPVQLERYAQVRAGAQPALAASGEYAFFRRRYPRAAAGELALAVVPDAALRRWCSARWRIGESRRMRAAAALAALQAEWIAAGARADWRPAVEPAGLGAVAVGPAGVRSALYGSLSFLTPVAELPLERATAAEAAAYRRFHQRYQSSWRDFLDPIAVQAVARADGGLGLDLSVLPLIVGSEYRELIALSGGASLEAGAGDPHPCAAQLAVALDRSGGPLADLDRHGSSMLGGMDSPFSWVGSTASLYADEDPFWRELAALPDPGRRWTFLQGNLRRLPVGASVAVADPLKLAAFLTGLRGMVAQSAPGLVEWNARSHREVPYVEIAPVAAQARGMGGMAEARLYYMPAPEGLVVSTSEEVMRRAIDRLLARRAGGAAPAPWPGRQCALVADAGVLRIAAALAGEGGTGGWMQRRAWASLPILNEWRRRFPGEDPVAVHERLWGVRPACPGGGGFRWDERWLTMESELYGHPDAPRAGPELPPALTALGRVACGLSFAPLPPAEADADGLAPGERAYVVQAGDTLAGVARSQGVAMHQLVSRNQLGDQRLQPGQRLVIPAGGRRAGASYALRVAIEVAPRP